MYDKSVVKFGNSQVEFNQRVIEIIEKQQREIKQLKRGEMHHAFMIAVIAILFAVNSYLQVL
jgi:hypothetical protein